jgi:nicotinamidase-related amidase
VFSVGNELTQEASIVDATVSDPNDIIRPERAALLIVDVQNDFCHPDGIFGRLGSDLSRMPEMAERLRELLESARKANVLTVFVRASEGAAVIGGPMAENYRRRGFNEGLCIEGSWGTDWYGGVQPAGYPNEAEVVKHRYSAFCGTSVDLYLRSNQIETVVVTGVVTCVCVDYSAADAFFKDYEVVIPADCVASTSPELHTATLTKFGRSFGRVMNAAEIARRWSAAVGHGRPAWTLEAKKHRVLANLEQQLDSRHTALLLVDLQNDFCDPAGVMGKRGEDLRFIQDTLPRIQEMLSAARRSGVMVVHVKAEYGDLSESDVTLANRWEAEDSLRCCVPQTWGADFLAGLAPVDGEPVVVKHRYSGFVDTRLDVLLRSNRIRTVVIVGVATHCCVESTARDANMRDYYVVMPEDCVAVRGRMRHLHEASLETLRTYFAQIVPSSTILRTWKLDTSTITAHAATRVSQNQRGDT